MSGTVTVINAGPVSWSDNDQLVLEDSQHRILTTASLAGVAPGGEAIITLNFTAPVDVGDMNFTLFPQDTVSPFAAFPCP